MPCSEVGIVHAGSPETFYAGLKTFVASFVVNLVAEALERQPLRFGQVAHFHRQPPLQVDQIDLQRGAHLVAQDRPEFLVPPEAVVAVGGEVKQGGKLFPVSVESVFSMHGHEIKPFRGGDRLFSDSPLLPFTCYYAISPPDPA